MNTTVLDKARRIWPGLSASDLDKVLWSLTTFPVGNPEDVLRDLRDAYVKSGGDFLQALYMADEERNRSIG